MGCGVQRARQKARSGRRTRAADETRGRFELNTEKGICHATKGGVASLRRPSWGPAHRAGALWSVENIVRNEYVFVTSSEENTGSSILQGKFSSVAQEFWAA